MNRFARASLIVGLMIPLAAHGAPQKGSGKTKRPESSLAARCRRAKTPESAIKVCSVLLEDENASKADLIFGYEQRATAHILLKEADKAVTDVDLAYGLGGRDSSFYTVRGRLHAFRDETDAALADYGSAIAADPRDGVPYKLRADLHATQAQWDEAVPDYKECLELLPQDLDCKEGLEKAEKQQKDTAAAVAEATKKRQAEEYDATCGAFKRLSLINRSTAAGHIKTAAQKQDFPDIFGDNDSTAQPAASGKKASQWNPAIDLPTDLRVGTMVCYMDANATLAYCPMPDADKPLQEITAFFRGCGLELRGLDTFAGGYSWEEPGSTMELLPNGKGAQLTLRLK